MIQYSRMIVHVLSVFIMFCSLSHTVFAAQDATITVEEAPIRERPSLDAVIIETKNAGTKIRISQYSKEGWYKTRTFTGGYGWVWQADLTILDHVDDLKTANLEATPRKHDHRQTKDDNWLFLRAGGLFLGVVPSNLSEHLGYPGGMPFWAPGGFAEISLKLAENLRLAFRVAGYYTFDSLRHSDGNQYDVTHSGIPILVGIDKDISLFKNFYVSAGLYAGLSFRNETTVTAPGHPVINAFTMASPAPAALMNFSAQYYFYNWISGIVEAGFYYSYIKQARVPSFNGDRPFRKPDGSMDSLYITHLGPMISFGFQFNL